MNALLEARRILARHLNAKLLDLEQSLGISVRPGQESTRTSARQKLKIQSCELASLARFISDQHGCSEADHLHKICILLGRPEHQEDTKARMQLLVGFYHCTAALRSSNAE